MTVGVVAFAILALFRLGLGLHRRDVARRRSAANRTLGPPDLVGPQIAGLHCAECDEKIVVYVEGMQCTHCDRPVHRECMGRHVRKPDGPYR